MTLSATATSTAVAPLFRVAAGRAVSPDIPALPDLTAPLLVRSSRVRRALALLAAFGGLRRDQLEALLLVEEAPLTPGSRRSATHRIAADLRRRGLLEDFVAGAASRRTAWRAYALSAAGEEAYARTEGSYPARHARRPASVLRLAHATMLADVALALVHAALVAGDIDLLWESSWQLAARLGARAPIPDAFVTVDHAGWRTQAFIEADRSTEWVTAFSRKVRRYIDLYRSDAWRPVLGAWPLVLTVTTSDRHARTLAETALRVAQQDGGGRIAHAFRFTSIDELRQGDPYDAIWRTGGGSIRVPMLRQDHAVRSGVDTAHEQRPGSAQRLRTGGPASITRGTRLDSIAPAAPSEMEKTDGSNLTNQTRHGT